MKYKKPGHLLQKNLHFSGKFLDALYPGCRCGVLRQNLIELGKHVLR